MTVTELRKGGFNLGQLYRTVSPALAFQYVSPKPPLESSTADDSSSGRVPTYFNNLNSWLGQTMQRDCPQVGIIFSANPMAHDRYEIKNVLISLQVYDKQF